MPTAQVVTIAETTHATVKKVTWDWLATDAGVVVGSITTYPYDGELIAAVFVPDSGGTAPDNGYDVTIKDVDGVDVLNGLGADLSNAATVIKKHTDGLGAVAGSKLTLAVANAGDANGGIIYLYIR
jgi:hypothetical protein